MQDTILGKKLGMTTIFDRKGNAQTVTLVQAGPCTILQVKEKKKDGYDAIQLGFDEKRPKSTTKPLAGHFAKTGSTPKRFIREVRVDDPTQYEPGKAITASLFKVGDWLDVTGTSKGKGTAGPMKAHNFKGFGMSHGVHETFRGPGSVGQHTHPGRVFKGVMGAGHLGDERVTIQNLVVVDLREDLNVIAVKGPIPGGKNGYVILRRAKKKGARKAAAKG
jgi:large subunit ribosomal protein L3